MKNKHIFNVVETLYESIQQKFQRELNPEHLYSIIWNKVKKSRNRLNEHNILDGYECQCPICRSQDVALLYGVKERYITSLETPYKTSRNNPKRLKEQLI